MKKNKNFKGLCLLLALVMLLSCTFAYFTDRASMQAQGTTGTVAIDLDNRINLLDANGKDIINPGDQRDASFTVTNMGNKSIDVRTTIVLTTQSENFDLTFSGDGATQSEYDLYFRDDVDFVEGKGYMPKEGAQPLQVKSIDQDVITYVLPEYMLNGNSDEHAEVETIDGVDAFAKEHDFVFVMKGEAGNEWQNSAVSIDVLVEAKQHENSSAGWDIVAQENVSVGNINQSAVKGESIITGENGENGSENENGNSRVNFSLKNEDNGAGIAGVPLTLYKKADASFLLIDGSNYTAVATTYSDSNGSGSFGELPAGEYALRSDILELTDADDISVDGTDIYSYEFSQSMGESREITFNVTKPDGSPMADAIVLYKHVETGFYLQSSPADENGVATAMTYEFGWPEGEYEVQNVVFLDGVNVHHLAANVSGDTLFEIDGDITLNIKAELDNVTFEIADQNFERMEGATIAVVRNQIPGMYEISGGLVMPTTDANGQFKFTLPNGTYSIINIIDSENYAHHSNVADFVVEGESYVFLQSNGYVYVDGPSELYEPTVVLTVMDENGKLLDAPTGMLLMQTEDYSGLMVFAQDSNDYSRFTTTIYTSEQPTAFTTYTNFDFSGLPLYAVDGYEITIENTSEDVITATLVINEWSAHDITFDIVDNSSMGTDAFAITLNGALQYNITSGDTYTLIDGNYELYASSSDFNITPSTISVDSDKTVVLTISDNVVTTVNVTIDGQQEEGWITFYGQDGVSYNGYVFEGVVSINNMLPGTYDVSFGADVAHGTVVIDDSGSATVDLARN